MAQNLYLSVGAEIRAIQARQRVSGVALAAKVSRSSEWVARRLNGNVSMSVADLVEISAALDADPAQVLHDALQARVPA